MSVTRLSAVLLLAASLEAAQETGTWSSAGIRDGVTLSFRDDEGLDARQVRAVAELPHAADRIVPLVCDFSQVLDPDVREARLLSGEVAGRYEIYLRYAPRFLIVSARDVVIDVQRHADGCSWTEVDRLPPQQGAVRMPLLRGSWGVERLGDSRSRVTYQIVVRPGGSIPGWMVRRGAIGALPDVIRRVSRCLSGSPDRTDGCPKPAS